jgi:hypothetical protein
VVLAHLRALCAEATQRLASEGHHQTSSWDPGAFDAPCFCVFHCFSFCGTAALLQARTVSTQWRLWSEGDVFWHPRAEMRWSGNAMLLASGMVPGSAMALYLRRCRLEQSYRALADGRNQDGIASELILLVELNSGHRRILNLLLTLSRDEGRLCRAKAVIPVGTLTFPVDLEEGDARLSLTIVRQSDGRLLRVCSERPLGEYVEEADEGEEEDTDTLCLDLGWENDELSKQEKRAINPLEVFVCLAGVQRSDPDSDRNLLSRLRCVSIDSSTSRVSPDIWSTLNEYVKWL